MSTQRPVGDALERLRGLYPHPVPSAFVAEKAAVIAAFEAERRELTGGFEGENRGPNPWKEVAGEWQASTERLQRRIEAERREHERLVRDFVHLVAEKTARDIKIRELIQRLNDDPARAAFEGYSLDYVLALLDGGGA